MLILAPIAAMLIQMAISRTREYRCGRGLGQVHRHAIRADLCAAEAGTWSKRIPMDASPATAHMFIIKPFSGRSIHESVLDTPFNRRAHRSLQAMR